MIRQCMDELSRGDIFEGIMREESMLSFVWLHKGDIKMSLPVLYFISFWYRHRYCDVVL